MGTSPHAPILTIVACLDSAGLSPSHSNPEEVLWSACPDAPAPAPATTCACTGTASGGGHLWASSSPPTVALLPSTGGGSLTFAAGRMPTLSSSGGGVLSLTTVTASRDGRATTLVVPAVFSGVVGGGGKALTAAGLSMGAQVGIGIGAAAVGLAAVGMGVAVLMLRRQRRRQECGGLDGETPLGGGESRMEGHGDSSVTSANDTDGGVDAAWGYKAELSAESRHVHRVELPADERVAVGRGYEEAGPVSPLSTADEEGAADGKEDSELPWEERRYGEGTRLEAIPEVVAE